VNAPKQHFKWPWFVLVAVLLGLALAIVWVAVAAKKVEQQRDFTPLPARPPAR
jgi:F0F1-type ATP synthase assembly protein I